MVTGATSLSLVRDELFATIEQAEQSLEQFIVDRHNGSLLQQAVESLQQKACSRCAAPSTSSN
jgi:hypothetical protein